MSQVLREKIEIICRKYTADIYIYQTYVVLNYILYNNTICVIIFICRTDAAAFTGVFTVARCTVITANTMMSSSVRGLLAGALVLSHAEDLLLGKQ